MAELFIHVYSEPGAEWDKKTAKAYLSKDYKNYPEFCLVALDDGGKAMGAIFCSADPYYKSKLLFIDSLQVKTEHRNKGVAKRLLFAVAKKAKEKDYRGIHLLTDERQIFPKKWYEKLGFAKTGWVEYESDFKDINLDLLE